MNSLETDQTTNKISPILSTLVVLGVLIFFINKGIDWYKYHSLIKEYDERIDFVLKNNNSQVEKCAVISNAINMANTLTDQQALDRYKTISQNNACDSKTGYVDGVSSQQDAASFAEQQANVIEDKNNLTTEEAKQFAVNLLKKINDDEKFILDAYELKEQATLEKYYYDVQAYMRPDPDDFSKSYWIKSDLLAPYTKCDTALLDLQLYALALKNQLREDSATMRKIVRQEKEDYQKSKAKCEERVNLTYEQALAADEAE